MAKAINERIANTDIFVLSYDSKSKLYTYSRPFTQPEAESLATATNEAIASQYGNARGLEGGLRAVSGELVNMSTLKGIVANQVLMQSSGKKQWLPTIAEGVQLQKQGMLPSGVLIDFGIALYDGEDPDKEIAQAMIATAGEKGYVLPVLASFKSLGLIKGGKSYEVTPQIASAEGLIFGVDAARFLAENSFYKGNSGVRRLGRSRGGLWVTVWEVDLGDFNGSCRVGRFSATGSAQKLREEALGAFNPIQQSLDSIVQKAEAER